MTAITHRKGIESLELPTRQEWWDCLRWVLLVFTFLIALSLAGSFASYQGVVAHGHPWLPHRICPGCPFCGMTRSFCAMSAGRLRDATAWNHGGPVLYIGGWIWLTGFCAVQFKYVRRHLLYKESADR